VGKTLRILLLSDLLDDLHLKNILEEIPRFSEREGISVEVAVLGWGGRWHGYGQKVKVLAKKPEFDEFCQTCDFAVCTAAYLNGKVLKVCEFLMALDKTILTFPADAWRYSGMGRNFLIQTRNAEVVTCSADILSWVAFR